MVWGGTNVQTCTEVYRICGGALTAHRHEMEVIDNRGVLLVFLGVFPFLQDTRQYCPSRCFGDPTEKCRSQSH